MANPLRVRTSPEHLAERRQTIEITENISVFERLSGIMEADLASLPAAKIPPAWRDSPVKIGLTFGWMDAREKLPGVTGEVAARIDAVCQRCLEPCEIRMQLPLSLLLLREGAATVSDSDYEVWETDDNKLRPLDLVEESLIMALPMAAMHEDSRDCGPLAGIVEPDAVETVRPFADLKKRIGDTNE